MSRLQYSPELAAILVLVAPAGRESEVAGIEQRQTCLRGLTLDAFGFAARRAEFRRIDIRDANFLALEAERVPVDDAVHMAIGAAD